MKEILDQYLLIGITRAEQHMKSFVECARDSLPEVLHGGIPTKIEDFEGLFCASTKTVSIPVFPDKDGYATLSAMFEFGNFGKEGPDHWEFHKYTYTLPGSIFSPAREFSATCIEDALVISRRISNYREKFATYVLAGTVDPTKPLIQ